MPSATRSTACDVKTLAVPVRALRATSTPRTKSLGQTGRTPFMSVAT